MGGIEQVTETVVCAHARQPRRADIGIEPTVLFEEVTVPFSINPRPRRTHGNQQETKPDVFGVLPLNYGPKAGWIRTNDIPLTMRSIRSLQHGLRGCPASDGIGFWPSVPHWRSSRSLQHGRQSDATADSVKQAPREIFWCSFSDMHGRKLAGRPIFPRRPPPYRDFPQPMAFNEQHDPDSRRSSVELPLHRWPFGAGGGI